MKLNKKGFTLIELLAVITILGILMLVAIPAVSRTIENSRRNTFLDNAQQYVKAASTQWTADNVFCKITATWDTPSGAVPAGTYNIPFTTQKTVLAVSGATGSTDDNAVNLVDQGGKSSWGNRDVAGIIKIVVDANGKAKYYVNMVDQTGHGIGSGSFDIEASKLDKTAVLTNGASLASLPGTECKVVE